MKKTSALMIVVTAVLGMLTSCGLDEPAVEGDGLSQTEELTTEATTAEITTEETTELVETNTITETSTETSEISGNDEYITALTRILDALSNGDMDKCIEYSLPHDVYKSAKKIGIEQIFEDTGIEDTMGNYLNYDNIEVVAVKSLESDEIEYLEKHYTYCKTLFNAVSDNGYDYGILTGDGVYTRKDNAEFGRIASQYDIETTKPDIHIESYEFVTYMIDGEEDTLPVFRAESEDLKIDSILAPMMIAET